MELINKTLNNDDDNDYDDDDDHDQQQQQHYHYHHCEQQQPPAALPVPPLSMPTTQNNQNQINSLSFINKTAFILRFLQGSTHKKLMPSGGQQN